MTAAYGRRRGNAIVETALMAPWLFFLFLGVFDLGFYAYASISTTHAARVAVEYTSGSASTESDTATACAYVYQELKALPNMPSSPPDCTALPVIVTAKAVAGPDLAPDGTAASASQVTVTYQTLPLFPLPWLTGQLTITRTATMRVRS